MTFGAYRTLVRSDLYRYTGKTSAVILLGFLLRHPGFTYTFWMRTCAFLASNGWMRYTPPYWVARVLLRRYSYKYGIYLPHDTVVGPGLCITHFGGIYVYNKARIGSNFTVDQEVLLGKTMRGTFKGAPTIGDNVYLAPGSKILGKVRVGDHAAVGANCVVTKDVPDHAVAVGVPARVISNDGSAGYVNNTWPPVQ
jgi:serine O-acetyltransferase